MTGPPHPYGRRVGLLIRQQRNRYGWTQGRVARHLGVAIRTVSHWERGLIAVPVNRLPDLADLFDVHPCALIPSHPRKA